LQPEKLINNAVKNTLKILLSLCLTVFSVQCSVFSSSSIIHHPSLNTKHSSLNTKHLTLNTKHLTLVKIQGRDIPKNAKSVTLSFNPEAGTLSGQATCNSYSANFVIGNQRPDSEKFQFSISNFQFTDIRCPEADMNAEGRFFAAFQKANNILISENSLTLYRDNKELLHFEQN